MPVAYSSDLRTRVRDAWNAREGTQAELRERFARKSVIITAASLTKWMCET